MWTGEPYASFRRASQDAQRGLEAEGKAANAVLAAKMETAKTGFGPGPQNQRTGARDAQSKRSKAFLSVGSTLRRSRATDSEEQPLKKPFARRRARAFPEGGFRLR